MPFEAFRRLKSGVGDISRSVATTLYKETGRVSDDPSSTKTVGTEEPERAVLERVKLTRVFTL